MELKLELAQLVDLPVCMEILNAGREFQREQGFVQWLDGFPAESQVREDILQQTGYVLKADGRIAAYFYLGFDGDASYPDIRGSWHSDGPYGVIHRIAIGNGYRGKGLADAILAMVEAICLRRGISFLRIDTGEQNKRMQHILRRNGFSFCGIVMQSGGERLAYDKQITG